MKYRKFYKEMKRKELQSSYYLKAKGGDEGIKYKK